MVASSVRTNVVVGWDGVGCETKGLALPTKCYERTMCRMGDCKVPGAARTTGLWCALTIVGRELGFGDRSRVWRCCALSSHAPRLWYVMANVAQSTMGASTARTMLAEVHRCTAGCALISQGEQPLAACSMSTEAEAFAVFGFVP